MIPAHAIVECANVQRADAIVKGTPGKRGPLFGRALQGFQWVKWSLATEWISLGDG
jgi:hypothetical protein